MAGHMAAAILEGAKPGDVDAVVAYQAIARLRRCGEQECCGGDGSLDPGGGAQAGGQDSELMGCAATR